MAKQSIQNIEVKDRRVLMRVDFNVPLESGKITDDRRITQALPSIRAVIDRGGKLILMSHLGRPKGQGFEAAFSLQPVAAHLAKLLGKDVAFAKECVGPDADRVVAGVKPGGIALLENLRFHAEETLIDKAEKNPDHKSTAEQASRIAAFADALAKHGDIYCNDAFGTCHRMHVSMYDVPKKLGPGKRVCGLLVQKELQFLGDTLAHPKKPFVAILGGAKVSDKIGVIESLLPKVEKILIGGAMTFTFLASKGMRIGKSLCETDKQDLARDLLRKAEGKIELPTDSVCAEELKADVATRVVAGDIDGELRGLDIGPATIKKFSEIIRGAKTVLWNGPMGVFETPPFDRGTMQVAQALADATKNGATTIIGGGDSAAAVEKAGLADKMTHISTGGGASLEFLEGKPFATINILDNV